MNGANYGRRVPGEPQPRGFDDEPSPRQYKKEYDQREQQSSYNQNYQRDRENQKYTHAYVNDDWGTPNKPKGLGFFDILQTKKKDISLSTDLFFRDLNFLIPEAVFLIGAAFFGVILLALNYFYSSFWLEELKKKVSAEAFTEVSQQFAGFSQLQMEAFIIMAIIPIGIFLFKFFMFHPSKNKVPVFRFWKTGAVRMSVEPYKDEMKFSNDPISGKVRIVDPRKHWDMRTGKPMIMMLEDDGENVSLAGTVASSKKDEEWSNMSDSIWGTACRWTEYQLGKKGGFPSTMLIVIFLIGGAAVIGLLMYSMGMIPGIGGASVSAAPVAQAGAQIITDQAGNVIGVLDANGHLNQIAHTASAVVPKFLKGGF